MDNLEELERRWSERAESWGSHTELQFAADLIADELSALRRGYVLVPREPTQEDVERVAQKIETDWEVLGVVPDARVAARSAWASIVGGTDET